MKRREFVTLLGGTVIAAGAWPSAAYPQQTETLSRVGLLGPSLDSPVTGPAYQIFVSELRKLGFTEGKNLILDHRRTDEGMPKAFTGANELAAAKAAVLVSWGPEIALQAAAAARPPMPIVMLAFNYDPFARGYIKSLAQPGGDITGLFYRQPELGAKQLELLVEAFPERKRLAVLWDLQSADHHAAVERAAESMGLLVYALKLEEPYDFEATFRMLSEGGAQMLHVPSTPAFTPHRARIAELAIQHRLPTMFIWRAYVEAGGLMSYGVDNGPMWRRAASYVAKILRGARPADLAVEQAANFEFSVNLKTANALGVTLPTSILLRADEVIE